MQNYAEIMLNVILTASAFLIVVATLCLSIELIKMIKKK